MKPHRRMRPSTRDHLDALSRPLRPHRSPVWSWDRSGFVWLPAWEDPGLPERDWPVLGPDWAAAFEALELLLARATCHHEISLAARCPDCSGEVAATLGLAAIAGDADKGRPG